MKSIFKGYKIQSSVLLALMFFLTALQSVGQQGLVPVNGIQVYYEVHGEGRPLILLHGAFMTNESNWGEMIPELSKKRKVIAIELQGHGHSPFSDRKLDFATLAKDVEGVMDHLKVDSADVMGYSFGGYVAYQLAIQSPQRVSGLVIISSTYKSTGWMPELEHAFKGMKPELFEGSPMQMAYNATAPDKTKWTKFLEHMIAFAQQPFDLGEANIAKITAPVLLIAGDNDGLDKIELVKTYQLLGGGVIGDFGPMPKSQLAIIPGQGHVSVMMQTKTILGYLDGFLK